MENRTIREHCQSHTRSKDNKRKQKIQRKKKAMSTPKNKEGKTCKRNGLKTNKARLPKVILNEK
jgi:hypothetical protein